MAKPTLQDELLDHSKPFVVEFTYRDKSGRKLCVETLTYPLKTSVKAAEERGLQTPWDKVRG